MAVTTLDQARTQRKREVANALASVRMEGLEPSAEAKGIFQRYVEGEVSLKEMGRAVDQLLDRQYGPVRLSRNDCS
ncbi:MAG: antitoxin VbhA family protein [Acidobacteriota bacterium]